jgi:uncharacterized protein (DUF362 family)
VNQVQESEKKSLPRRTFLQGAAAALATSGCAAQSKTGQKEFGEISAEQKAERKKGRSIVGIVGAHSYEEDLFLLFKKHIGELGLPRFDGKHVVIKPNMVEFQAGHPITTNPALIRATVQLADFLGAKQITIAEGPGHMRDTEFLLEATGIGRVCHELGLPFLDLNLDDVEKAPIERSLTGLTHFYLPKTIVHADAVISLPKMKTHHWVGVTASMKNLFGTVPGRKYGYPKNFLHWQGIDQCILDLNRIIKPPLAIVDAIVAMEGDGPINGMAKQSNFIVIGTDLPAVDATCARTMRFNPEELPYLRVAGQVIGNIALGDIDIVGSPIDTVAQEFLRPITFTHAELRTNPEQQGS